MLKAFLVYHGVTPEKTHDLVRLLTECASFEEDLEDLESACDRLSFYAVEVRYPSLHVPGEEEGRAMTDRTRLICDRILALLSPDEA